MRVPGRAIVSDVRRSSILYVGILSLVGGLIYLILQIGADLPAPAGSPPAAAVRISGAVTAGNPAAVVAALEIARNFDTPLSRLFLQLLVIVVVSRVGGRAFTAIGQPAVVGEMAAGILLGPSLFGWLAPGAHAFVFPPASLDTLKLLSQIGVCLFLFSVGMELDLSKLRGVAHSAIVVSHASIVVPMLFGSALALFLYGELAAPGARFPAFALFMGISMSITAFPVLARILQERGISRTPLGHTAITCAAVDDATAWSLLAFVVAIARASSLTACAVNLVLVLAFVAVMTWIVKPSLPRWLGPARIERENPSRGTLAIVLCVVVASALCTEAIGIHALFGAFLAGAIMPESGGFRHRLGVRIENLSSVLLLPIFFVFVGLRTQFGLLDDARSWLLCIIVTAVATLGKLGAAAFAARLTGIGWVDALQLGALMNTRGLMELIALNVGYELGILSPRIFTMLVIMAVVTTMLTGPLLSLFGRMREPAPSGLDRARRSA